MSRYLPPRGKKLGQASPHYRLISPPNDRHETTYLGDDPYESYNWQTIGPPVSSRTPRSFEFDARAAAHLDDEPGSYHGYPAIGPPSSAPSGPGNYHGERAIGPSSYASRQPGSREGYQDAGPGTYNQIHGHGSYGQNSGRGIHGQDFGHLDDDEGYGHGSHHHYGQHHGGPQERDAYDGTSHRHYGHGRHHHHGQHHGGSHEHHAHKGSSHRQGKQRAYGPSIDQPPHHHDSGRSGGHRGHAYDEEVLHDQMLAMSLQHKEDEYSLALVLGEPSQRYLEGPRSQALIGYEYGEQSISALVPTGHGGRHRGHEGVSDPHLGHYETISPKSRGHHGKGSNSSLRTEACGVCFEDYPETDLYKLCPGSKCPLFCADCTKDYFKTAMKSMPIKPVLCCKQSVSIDPVKHLFRPGFVTEYWRIQMEFDTEDKLYCSHKKCSAFIPPQTINGRDATCQECGKQTCTRCKNASHRGKPCRSNPEDEKVKELGYRKGWRPCAGCSTLTSKRDGCDHIVCTICGTSWCYRCGSKDCDTQQCQVE